MEMQIITQKILNEIQIQNQMSETRALFFYILNPKYYLSLGVIHFFHKQKTNVEHFVHV